MKLKLVPVNDENRPQVLSLSVGTGQEHFIETVEECLKEANRNFEWEPVCICDKDTMIGFAMYGNITLEKGKQVWIDRFLIDHHYQHMGYGKKSVKLIIDQLHTEFPDMDIRLSVYEDNEVAISLYESFGFIFNDERDINGEAVMILKAIG